MYGVQELEFFVSAIVWVPYTALLFYLFSEHYTRSRNLQSNILLLLASGSVFRCVWFFIDDKVWWITSEIVNRIALLLQFSGLSLLMLMWTRAIAISKMTDIAFQESGGIETNSMENGRDAVLVDRLKLRLQRYQEATQAVMNKLTSMNSFQHYIIIVSVVNVVVWGFVLGTLADVSQTWYDINIIAISVACVVVAVGTLFVGLWVSTALHVALTPVYISNSSNATYNKEQVSSCVCMGRYGATCEYIMGCCGLCSLYAFIFNYNQSDTRQGLQMQREVLKVILSVSSITSLFFLLRAFCFIYRPVIEKYGGTDGGVFGDVTYPFFFYQVPEMVPNLVIALGISPPGGVLRRAFNLCIYGYRVVVRALCCGRRGSRARLLNPQQSVFDSESASQSPMDRPSYLPEVLAAPNAQALGAAPVPVAGNASAPIAIPITRKHNSINNNKTSKSDLTSTDIEAPPLPATATGRKTEDLTTQQETLSPVHMHSKSSSLMEEAPPGESQSNSLYSRDTGSSSSMGGMSSFQVEGGSVSGSVSGSGMSRTKSTGSNNFLSYVSRSVATLRSARSSMSGSSHGGSNSVGGNSVGGARGSQPRSPRPQSRRGSGGMFDYYEEDDEWARERRNSAEINEMLYRFNSFSTSEPSGGLTNASSLSSGYGHSGGDASRNVSTQSVDSNTISNSRRHYITDVVGGNRTNPNSVAGTPADSSKIKKSWFF